MPRNIARQRGIAIILVITVLMALMLIGTPFVLSMILQEKSSVGHKEQRQADYGAEGARNYAAWKIMYGHDYMERRFPSGLDAPYYADTFAEFRMRPTDNLSADMIQNPQGTIWGVNVSDEQGKIHVGTAPAKLIGRIQSLIDSRILDPKDYLTQYSVRPVRWIFPQSIRGVGSVPVNPTNTVYGLSVDDATHFGSGATLRVSRAGFPEVEVEVVTNWVASGANVIETSPQVAANYSGGVVELQARHPVNINTAPREVLIAIFEGLHIVGTPDSPLSRDQATSVADAFYRKKTERWEDYITTIIGVGDLSPLQMVAVGINGVNADHALLGGTGTLPITFRSGDVITVEAFSSINAPSGIETAGRGFREVISVVPPIPLTHYAESQLDFNHPLQASDIARTLVQNAPKLYGYPFGNRIITFPNLFPNSSDDTLGPAQQPPEEAYFQIEPAVDNRGTAQLINFRDHFNSTHEGQDLQGSGIRYSWDQVLVGYPRGAQPPQQMPDVAAGGIEFWIRFDSVRPGMTLFDLRETDSTNRISLEYDDSSGIPELVFTLADGTLGDSTSRIDNGVAEIRHPLQPTADDTWYHVGAYWKGTRYAHAALLVDGFADPTAKFKHVNPEGETIITTLGGALDPGATSWTLADDTLVPSNESSAWLIGAEVVEWDPLQSLLIRGARGTTAQSHPAQATVQIFGYSSKLRNMNATTTLGAAGDVQLTFDRVTTGGGQLSYQIGMNPQATVMGDKTDDDTNQTYVDDTQTDIPVTTTDITEFPDQGHILIETEVIYYGARSGTTFSQCERGAHGTIAARHNTGQQVALWGLPTTDTTNYIDGTIVRIDDEWFGPVYKDDLHPNHWRGYLNGTTPGRLLRGPQVMSVQELHSAGAGVWPIFAARESDITVNRENMGGDDRVTITDAASQSESARIHHAKVASGQWQFSIPNGQLASFETDLGREYVADELHVRVLKFPSGELVGLNFLQTYRPDFTVAPLEGTLDEIKIFASPKGNFATGGPATTSDTMITMNNTAGIAATGGLIKIGDELVGYSRNRNNVLDPVTRGFLNSPVQVHDQGDLAFNMAFIPVANLDVGIGPTDPTLRISEGTAAAGGRWYFDRPNGFVVMEYRGAREVMMYTGSWRNSDGTISLEMPSKVQAPGEGMFRGRFGTPSLSFPRDCLVYFLPYRWWDTYVPMEFDNRMAYWQTSSTMEGARWKEVRWTEEIPAGDRNLKTHVLLRIDGKGEWVDAPGSDLLEFTDPQGGPVNRFGFEKDAGQIDLRVYFGYEGGFWPAHSWKRAVRIREIQVDYDRPTRTLYHEDR